MDGLAETGDLEGFLSILQARFKGEIADERTPTSVISPRSISPYIKQAEFIPLY
jgi:hypothetical protein